MIDFSAFVPEVTPLIMLSGGLLAFLSPCVLPMLPVYALYLFGVNGSDERAGWPLLLRRCLGLSFSFILLFTLIGAGAGLIGSALKQADRGVLNFISGLLLLLAGLGMLGLLRLPGPNMQKASRSTALSGFWSSFFFGLLLAFSWTPCITPALASALVLAASAENATMLTGMGYLALFALGLCLPMLLFMLLYQWLQNALKWLRMRQLFLRRMGGVLMAAYGIYLVISVFL